MLIYATYQYLCYEECIEYEPTRVWQFIEKVEVMLHTEDLEVASYMKNLILSCQKVPRWTIFQLPRIETQTDHPSSEMDLDLNFTMKFGSTKDNIFFGKLDHDGKVCDISTNLQIPFDRGKICLNVQED